MPAATVEPNIGEPQEYLRTTAVQAPLRANARRTPRALDPRGRGMYKSFRFFVAPFFPASLGIKGGGDE
jgi:hypothetical protein